jgi:MHS family proline/betaine transporter-like MFS transporter
MASRPRAASAQAAQPASPVSLIEEFLLLALEDEGGEFSRIPETSLSCGLAGAALMDLAIRGRIDSDLHHLWVVDPTPTDSAMLNEVLAEIAAEPARLHPREWIARLMPQAVRLRGEAIQRLCERGILRQEDHEFLWVLQARRYPVERGEERLEGKRRILALLFNSEIPDPQDAALVALADACGVFERILGHGTLEEAGPRIRQLRRLDLIGAEIAHTAEVMNREIRGAERKTVIAGLAGNVMEWYDFGIYGYFAAVMGQKFFPAHDPATSLMASFGVFAVGFLGRPLGALIFGYLGDRHGRKHALTASVLMMAIPTLFIGLAPTYAQIGIAAPVLLIVLRLCQGLAVGGEFTTSMVLLVESAQSSRRGIVGSFAPTGASAGMLLGSIVGAAVTGLLPAAAIASWGWRAAFLFGLVIGVVVMIVRRRLPPDPTIEAISEARKSPVVMAFKTEWRTILRIAATMMTQGIGFYLNFVYLATWLTQYTHISKPVTLLLNAVMLALQLVLLPVWGSISDRIGRKAQLVLGTLGFILLTWPLYTLIDHGSLIAVLAGQVGFAVIQSTISSAMPAFNVESLPKHVRCTALSSGYNLAQAVFGGTVPMVAVALIAATGYRLAPSLYLTAVAVVSFLVVLTWRMPPEEKLG